MEKDTIARGSTSDKVPDTKLEETTIGSLEFKKIIDFRGPHDLGNASHPEKTKVKKQPPMTIKKSPFFFENDPEGGRIHPEEEPVKYAVQEPSLRDHQSTINTAAQLPYEDALNYHASAPNMPVATLDEGLCKPMKKGSAGNKKSKSNEPNSYIAQMFDHLRCLMTSVYILNVVLPKEETDVPAKADAQKIMDAWLILIKEDDLTSESYFRYHGMLELMGSMIMLLRKRFDQYEKKFHSMLKTRCYRLFKQTTKIPKPEAEHALKEFFNLSDEIYALIFGDKLKIGLSNKACVEILKSPKMVEELVSWNVVEEVIKMLDDQTVRDLEVNLMETIKFIIENEPSAGCQVWISRLNDKVTSTKFKKPFTRLENRLAALFFYEKLLEVAEYREKLFDRLPLLKNLISQIKQCIDLEFKMPALKEVNRKDKISFVRLGKKEPAATLSKVIEE